MTTTAARRGFRSSRSARRRRSTNTQFWSLRSTTRRTRSVSSLATGGRREHHRRDEEPIGPGRSCDARTFPRRLAACVLALVDDWWNIFVRLVDPDLHREAITSRPLFLAAIAARARHARQTTIRLASSHARAEHAANALAAVARFLRRLAGNAEQLTRLQTWRLPVARRPGVSCRRDCSPISPRAAAAFAIVLIPEEAAPQFRNDAAPL